MGATLQTTIHIKNYTAAHITADGKISFSEASDSISNYYTSSNPRPPKNILWDLRNASAVSITASQVTKLADLSASYSEQRGGGKTAIVASTDLDFGIAKEFEGHSMSLSREFVIFRDIDKAYKWIEE